MLKRFTIENLGQYDQGSLGVHFNEAMRRVYLDLEDRPRISKPRKVVIEIELKPVEVDGELDRIEARAICKCNIPNRESRTNTLVAKSDAGILFNPMTSIATHPTFDFPEESQSED